MICNYPPPPPAFYEEMVSPYRDQFGLIVQSDKDGGDATHRIGLYYYGLYLIYKDSPSELREIKEKFNADLNKVKIGPGQFVRHPDPKMWYSNPKNFSRDQTSPLVITMGAFGNTDDLIANLKNLIKNGGFYPNDLKNWTNEKKHLPDDYNDVAGMGDYAAYIRSFKAYPLYPYLVFADVTLFGSSLIRTFFSYFDKSDTSDDLNFTLHLLQADDVMPTPFSKLAKFIYSNAKGRVLSPNSGYQSSEAIQTSWDYYFRKEAAGPPINDVYRCIIGKSFYNEKYLLDKDKAVVVK